VKSKFNDSIQKHFSPPLLRPATVTSLSCLVIYCITSFNERLLPRHYASDS